MPVMSVGPTTSIAARPHRVTLQNPGPPVQDGEGGYTQTWTDLSPASVSARIETATASGLERLAAGTTIATASHVITMPYHPQVTASTRILFNGRIFYVNGPPVNPDERNVETIAICREVVP